MSTAYPLVGYHFAILENKAIAATGKVLQGCGSDSYLVRFETKPKYTRVYHQDAPFFTGINLFETEDELGDFVQFIHTNVVSVNDAARVTPEALGEEEELPEDPEVEDPEPSAA